MSLSILLSLLPPILVLAIGIATRRIILAIIMGIFTAAFIASQYAWLDAITLTFSKLYDNLELGVLFISGGLFDCWNLLICCFLLLLGITITALQQSGSTQAYVTFVQKYIHTKKTAESASMLLSVFLFIDDYFSALTVGATMRPIADKYQIPRVKLAFLVDSLAAPLTILCPFSTWAAAVLGFLRENGVSETLTPQTLVVGKPLFVYFHLLPYLFYSFLIMLATFIIVRFRVSYGQMGKFERLTTQNPHPEHPPSVRKPEPKTMATNPPSLTDFILPIVFLVVCIFLGLLYSGGWILTGGEHAFLDALPNANAAIALFTGGCLATLLTFCFLLIRKRLILRQCPKIAIKGILLMLPSVIILVLAWTLGDLLRNNLHTGQEIANVMRSIHITNVNILPVLFFIFSFLVSFSIGSAWGTAAILFPIAVPMILALTQNTAGISVEAIPILYPTLGAILSGCVAGDHISPISDTTLMTSSSTQSKHLDHVNTQMGYTIPVIIATIFAFIFMALCPDKMGYFAIPISILGAFSLYATGLFMMTRQKSCSPN